MSNEPDVFTCPKCLADSHHPVDAAEGYCGRCHMFFPGWRDEVADFEAQRRRDVEEAQRRRGESAREQVTVRKHSPTEVPTDRARRYRFPIQAGALVRRGIRTMLDVHGLPYVEHKGWLESSFVVSCTLDEYRALNNWINKYGDGGT